MPGYLDRIERLVGSRPDQADVNSPQLADQLLKDLSENIKTAAVSKKVIPFAEKLSRNFSALIEELELRNPNPVFIWIDATKDCGFVKPIRLSAFRFGFEFDSIPEGIVALITADVSDEMLLDFETDDQGIEVMTIELHGTSWGHVELDDLWPPTAKRLAK